MRGLIIGLPLSALLWWAGFEYGFEGIALVAIALLTIGIIASISRDLKKTNYDEPWADGEPVNYGKDK